jgi:hypothetical protein
MRTTRRVACSPGADARAAFVAAGAHAPNRLLYRLLVNYVDLPRGFDRAVCEVWDVLIGT